MHEAEKLEEAEFFLKQMASAGNDDKAYTYNLSAFISAARSILFYARSEAKRKSGSHAWIEQQESGSSVISFFTSRRNVSIHKEPVSPEKQLRVHIGETLHFSDMNDLLRIIRTNTDTVLFRDDKSVPSIQTALVADGTNWPYPSKVAMTAVYRFSEWKGAEDATTLCTTYLGRL
ncbi:MAG: hypothetical protein DMG77_00765 [Acidobacteria bacterium]|nr:MAG: hypothetical protein DMG77_00765 [Acidobacteriota bacterium]